MKTIATINAPTIQAMLREIETGVMDASCPPLTNWVSHSNPEVPPRDAAAAEMPMSIGLTGLKSPEMQKSAPPAMYEGTASPLALVAAASSLPTRGRSQRAAVRAKT